MKKILIIIVIILLISVCYTLESHYTRDAEVISVDCIEVVVEDGQGFVWCFSGEGYEVGQMVTLEMSDNYTSTIKDDIILNVKAW